MAVRYPLSILWASGDAIHSDKFGFIYAGPLWFLLALFWIREVFYFGAGWITLKNYKYQDEIILVVCMALSLVVKEIHPLISPFPWSICQGLAAIEFYAIGWYAHKHGIKWWLKVLFIICWPLAIFFGGMELSACVYKCYPLDVLGACGAVYILYVICDYFYNEINSIFPSLYVEHKTLLQWIGINSLVILCVHTIDLQSGMIYSVLCRIPFKINMGWLIAFRMVLAVAISMAFINIKSSLERLPDAND